MNKKTLIVLLVIILIIVFIIFWQFLTPQSNVDVLGENIRNKIIDALNK